jgi:hypothetical protein
MRGPKSIIIRAVAARGASIMAATIGVAMMDAVHALGPAAASDPSVSCGIDPDDSGAGLDLSAFVLPERDLAGSFRFGVEQAGSGGYTAVGQSGEFEAAAGVATEVGLIRIGNPDDGSYVARLEILDTTDGMICAAFLP